MMIKTLLFVQILGRFIYGASAQSTFAIAEPTDQFRDSCAAEYGIAQVSTEAQCREAARSLNLKFTLTNTDPGGCWVRADGAPNVDLDGGVFFSSQPVDPDFQDGSDVGYVCVSSCPWTEVCQYSDCNGESCVVAFNKLAKQPLNTTASSASSDPSAIPLRSSCSLAFASLTRTGNCPQCNKDDATCNGGQTLYSLPEAADRYLTRVGGKASAVAILGLAGISALVAALALRRARRTVVKEDDPSASRSLVVVSSYVQVRSEEADGDTDGAFWLPRSE